MATAIDKWKDVTIPEGLGTKLTDLANGINMFSFAFVGGWSMSSLVGPLGDMATAVNKWKDVTFPEGLGTNLSSLASGVASFTTFDISTVAGSMNTLATSIQQLAAISYEGIIEGVNSLAPALTETATNAITAFVEVFTSSQNTVKNSVDGLLKAAESAINNSSIIQSFYNSGKSIAEGFARGISDNASLVTQAVDKLVNDAQSRANTKLEINSPSKVFMRTGASVVEGFTKGITDNLEDVKDSAVTMGNTILDATKKNLKINSPSLVFNKEVGRYVVQGIAEGIKGDMSAEEQAEKKAQNIIEAFQKEFDKLSISSDIAKNDFDLWAATDGKYATPETIDAKELEYLNAEVQRANDKKALAYNQWVEMNERLKTKEVDEQKEREAWNSYLEACIESAGVHESIAEINQRALDREYENLESAKEIRDLEHEIWQTTHEHTATDSEKDKRTMDYLEEELKHLTSTSQLDVKAYNDAIKTYGAESKEALEALKKCYETDKLIAETRNGMVEINQRALNGEYESLESAKELNDLEHERWQTTNDKSASEAEKDKVTSDYLNKELKRLNDKVLLNVRDYNQAVNTYGKESEQALEALKKCYETDIEIAKTRNSMVELAERAVDREYEALENAQSVRDAEYDLWMTENDRTTTEAEKDKRTSEYLNATLKDLNNRVLIDVREYKKAVDDYGAESKEALEALQKCLATDKEIAKTKNDIAVLNDKAIDREYASINRATEIRDSEYEIWQLSNNKSTTDIQKDQRYIKYLNDGLAGLYKQVQLDVEAYNEAIRIHGKESDEALAALNKCYKTDIEIAKTEQSIAQVSIDAAERQRSMFEEAIAARDKEYKIWETEHEDASAAVKDSMNLERLKANLSDLRHDLSIAKANYIRIVEEYGAASEEAKTAADAIVNIRSDMADCNKEITNVYEEAKQRELELHELKSSNVDLEYQLWEKTAGREAASTERDLMKIATLTRQMSEQSELLENTRDEWRDACRKYGEYSTEAQNAYSEYLNKQLDMANIQNEILDIEERAKTKQKNALRDYNDYIKKYKKYYLQNGMTEADLIKDAKLVSGYDPDNTVKTIAEKTKAAIKNMQESDLYGEVIGGFNDMGTSYVTALYDGITSETENITGAMVDMINSCAKAIKQERSNWVEVGEYLTQGLAEGMSSNLSLLTNAVNLIMSSAIVSGETALMINSPSKVFANMGRYAVMGFAQGLIENCKMSDAAVSEVAYSAIDSLRNTISHISDTLDADMDTQPTITPVLDLSNIKTGVARLNTMISTSRAMGISASMSGERTETNQNGSNNTDTGTTYQYTQYNYSPKALSRTEIYRQTKTLLATKKGARA